MNEMQMFNDCILVLDLIELAFNGKNLLGAICRQILFLSSKTGFSHIFLGICPTQELWYRLWLGQFQIIFLLLFI
jgi:hypothetical protein